MSADSELLEAWRAGSASAGDELVQSSFDLVYRFARSKVDPDDVSDLVQRTFLAAVEGRDRVRAGASVRAYLLGIARNLVFNYWKARRRGRETDIGSASLHDQGPSPSTLVDEKGERRLLVEALRRIPLDLQIAIELHYLEEMSGPEIAEVLGIPEGTVRSRLRRGLEAARQAVQTLGQSGDLLESTLTDLERWASSLTETESQAG